MLTTIKISKPLRKYVNGLTEVVIDCDSYFNLISNLVNLFPDLKKITNDLLKNKQANIWLLVNNKMLCHDQIQFIVSKKAEIVLIPMIYGSGDDVLMIFAGVALVIAAVALMQPQFLMGAAVMLSGGSGLGAVFATAAVLESVALGMLSMGVGMALSGIVGAMASPKDKNQTSPDSSVRASNDAFGSFQNTTSTNEAIPLIFGQMRVPGQFIGGRIRTINHDAYTTISVANYL